MNLFKKLLKEGWYTVAISILILFALEIVARIYISFVYGSQIAGLPERTLNLKYQPFVMWGENLPHRAKEFNKKQGSGGQFTVLVLGGSVAQGFVPYEKILEESLQRSLNNQKKVAVFNAGFGGYNARQAAISLVLLSENLNADAIVVIDGYNDLSHSLRPGVDPEAFYLNSSYDLLLTKPFLAPFFYILQQSQLYNGIVRTVARTYVEETRKDKLIVAEGVYQDARKVIENYGKGKNIPTLFVLQPYVGFSGSDEDSEARFKFKYKEELLIGAFHRIAKMSGGLRCFVDSNDEIHSKKLNLGFSDDVHFKDERGYEYLSSTISKNLISCLGRL